MSDNAMLDTARAWQYLDEEGARECQVMYRNHYGDHDLGYESVIHPRSVDSFQWVRLNHAEALAFAAQLPEVRALGTQLQAVMWTLENMLNQFGDRWPMQYVKACRTSLELGQATLAPFETASDEGDHDYPKEG